MRVIFIGNARLPNKKAYGIQIGKMCEAFVEAGVDLELVIPRTRASSAASLKDAYRLRVEIPTTILPGLDWYGSGRLAFFVSSCVFICTSMLYLWGKRIRGEQCIVYTVDMDTFSFALLPFAGFPVVAEMHDVKPPTFFNRYFFNHTKLIIATNAEIRQALCDTFEIPAGKTIIEPNGVDLRLFADAPAKADARARLNIPQEQKVALYVGRFYAWKGLDILADAAALAPSIEWYVVGDTREVFERVTGRSTLPSNFHIAGECASDEVPAWLAAADALLILGTKRNEQSYRYTAPMKVYEYMAARRPIVASKTPALTSIIPQGDAAWYEPDDAASLAQAAERALTHVDERMLERNLASAREHSWSARAARVIGRLINI